MLDESQLTVGILENFRKCLELREKYMTSSLQHVGDDPKNMAEDAELEQAAGFGYGSGDGFGDGLLPGADSVRQFNGYLADGRRVFMP